MANKPITKPILIAVEGLDYLHLLLKSPIATDLEFQRSVLLWDFTEGGLDLAQFLSAIKKQRNFDSITKLGILRDAETDAKGMADSICSHLKNNGFAAPTAPKQIEPGAPATSFLVMPDGANSGCLEHACISACTKPEVLICASAFLDCVGRAGYNANWQAKVQVHAAIAGSGHNPSMTLGQSGQTGLWDFAQPSLKVMVDFIRRMY